MAALGLSGCVAPASDQALCIGLKRPVADLRQALIGNEAETPKAVGEAGADVVIGFEAGCLH